MAIQTRIAILKLADDDSKALGVSHLTADPVTCTEGLVEGVDFAVDRVRGGTIRRLRPFGRELYHFAMQYDDLAEVWAAETAALAAWEAREAAAVAATNALPTWATITADQAQVLVDQALAFGDKTEAQALAAVDAAGTLAAMKPIVKQMISAFYAIRAIDEKTARLLVHLRDIAVERDI